MNRHNIENDTKIEAYMSGGQPYGDIGQIQPTSDS